METKQEIRKKILEQRKSLAQSEYKLLSRAVIRNLFLLREFKTAKILHTYAASKYNEVDTLEMIVECMSQSKKIIVPIADFHSKTMTHSVLHSVNDLQKNAFGILEPAKIDLYCENDFDVVLVPVAACDEKGNRIGFGGGFYDKFLNNVQSPKIGLAFEFQIISEIPSEEHDQRLDFIISERRILSCR